MFKSAFKFHGRIRRTEYGISFIIYLLVYFTTMLMLQSGDAFAIPALLVLIPLIWFKFAQAAKRCHDIGNSGWWQLILLCPALPRRGFSGE